MMTVAPVLVARTMGRSNSSARMRLICRCWSIATVLPNQPMLLTLTNTVGAWPGRKARAQLFAKQVFVADVGRQRWPRQANDGWPTAPRLKSPSGMFIRLGEPLGTAAE
jgi:hypothetical protein